MPPVAIGANVVTGTGTSLAEPRLRGDPLRRSQLRVGQRPRRSCRSSAAGSRAPGCPDRKTSDCRQVRAGPASVKPSRLMSTDPAMPGRRQGVAICSPYSRSRVRSTSSSSTSMTTSGRALSIAAIRRPAAAMRSGVSLIEIALVAVIGEICRTSTTMRSRSIDFLDVGVAQVERADDRLFVLAALGGRVGNDRDRARRGDAVERVGARGERRQRVRKRRVAQVDGDAAASRNAGSKTTLRSAKRPIAVNTHRLPRVAEHQRVGQLDALGQVEARRRQVARPLDQSSAVRSCRRATRPSWCAASAACPAARRRLRRRSDSVRTRAGIRPAPLRTVPVAASRRPRKKCSCEARSCGALEGEPRASRFVGLRADGVGVFDDRAVVVLRRSACWPRTDTAEVVAQPAGDQRGGERQQSRTRATRLSGTYAMR